MKSVSDLGDLAGKRVLIRCDFNVPLDGTTITDDGRIRAALPTLTALREAGARVMVLAHLGRPKGEVNPKYSLAPAATRLGELLGTEVTLAADVVGPSATAVAAALGNGDVGMCENVRYEPGEQGRRGAGGAGREVRPARRRVRVGRFRGRPSQAGVGLRRREAAAQRGRQPRGEGGRRAREAHRAPRASLRGGARWGQGGRQAGGDAANVETCKGYLEAATQAGKQILLPVDLRVADSMDFAARTVSQPVTVVAADAIPADQQGLDIGPESEKLFAAAVESARTVFWNGPMGVFEIAELAGGTKALAEALASSSAFSVVGGGDSAAAVRQLGFADDAFGHISTGGGASLEYLEGKTLPGLDVLKEA